MFGYNNSVCLQPRVFKNVGWQTRVFSSLDKEPIWGKWNLKVLVLLNFLWLFVLFFLVLRKILRINGVVRSHHPKKIMNILPNVFSNFYSARFSTSCLTRWKQGMFWPVSLNLLNFISNSLDLCKLFCRLINSLVNNFDEQIADKELIINH